MKNIENYPLLIVLIGTILALIFGNPISIIISCLISLILILVIRLKHDKR